MNYGLVARYHIQPKMPRPTNIRVMLPTQDKTSGQISPFGGAETAVRVTQTEPPLNTPLLKVRMRLNLDDHGVRDQIL